MTGEVTCYDAARLRLSIVIVNWNSRDDLRACLESLAAQTYRDLEILVVDNGSTDGSAAMVSASFPACRLLAQPGNIGFAEGCNRGIEAATGEWVATLNNDCVAEPGWAQAIVEAAAARARDVRDAAVPDGLPRQAGHDQFNRDRADRARRRTRSPSRSILAQ